MRRTWATVLASLMLLGCGDDDGATTAEVVIAGNYSLTLGDTLQLSATTHGGTDSSYSWTSADDDIASVDATGLVTPVAVGEVEIWARGDATNAVGTHPVIVVSQGDAAVQVTGPFSVLLGQTAQLTATTVNRQDSAYTWASSDEAVALVDGDGVVTGIGPGDVTISATGADSGVSGSIGIVVSAEVPNFDKWLASGHADRTAEAFRHWDTEDPAEIPTSCARCHSATGFQDYLGADGSQPFFVDAPAPVGTLVECAACHNPAAEQLSQVEFPSGVIIDELGAEARCMTCHQGRSSTDDVDEAIATAAPTDDDAVTAGLNFLNIHYYAAGATLNAGRARGGYQYADQTYDWRFRHAPGVETCTGCHDPHSLEVKLDACAGCHTGVTTLDDLKGIRMIASLGQDYDGDGDTSEGMYYEMDGMRGRLYLAIQAYADQQGLPAICYDGHAHPYWFIDGDGDGACSETEAVGDNRFSTWSPRLLRAAYNYQVAQKDPGAFAHNSKYMIQLLYDSTADLGGDMAGTVRNDSGHFNGASEAARHWDEDEAVEASCSKCHGGSEGFRFYLTYGVGKEVHEQDNGLDCATCHDDLSSTFALVPVTSVLFPSEIRLDVSDVDPASNLCGTCHSGRNGKQDVDAAIAAGGSSLRFLNVHYLPAAATLAGGDAQVGYEYAGKAYAGRWMHPAQKDCTGCHNPVASDHTFQVADSFTVCMACHTGATQPRDIRGFTRSADHDGDGDRVEPSADELAGMAEALYDELRAYAAGRGSPLCYAHANPYFFKDTNGDGECSQTEAVSSNRYGPWDAALMKATFNYQLYEVETASWAHNFDYMGQLLFDSAEDLGGPGAVSGLVRP